MSYALQKSSIFYALDKKNNIALVPRLFVVGYYNDACMCADVCTVYLHDLHAFIDRRAHWCSSGEAETFV